MKRRAPVWIAALALAIGAVLPPSAPAPAQTRAGDDLVLAVVNGEEITHGQLVARLLEYRGEESLEKLINRALLRQAAERLKLSVTEQEVDRKLAEIQGRFKTEKEYRDFLQANRLREAQFREELRHTLLIQKVALHENPIRDEDLEQLDARILQSPDRATVEKWIRELNNGASFSQLAAREAPDPALRQAGGRLRPFLRIEMLDVARAIDEQKLTPGAYTREPVRLGNNTWAVIKLEGRIPVSAASAVERDRLTAAVTAYRVDQWIQRARQQARIERKPLDQPTVAVVNGEAITRSQLIAHLLANHGEESLELMANRALLLQAARAQNTTVSQEEADRAFEKFRAQFQTDDEYRAFLTRVNVSEKQVRDELRYTVLMEKVALKESPVTEEDLRRYDVRLLIAPSKAAAEAWIRELEKGGDFEAMVAERSADPDGRASGGRVRPFLRIERLDVWRALDSQKVAKGSFTRTPVLLHDGTWAIIKLVDVLPAPSGPERERLAEAVKRYRVAQWLNQTRARARISYPTALSLVIGR